MNSNQQQNATISSQSPNNVTRQSSWFPLHFSITINDQGELSIQTDNNTTKTDEISTIKTESMETVNTSTILISSSGDNMESDNNKNYTKRQQSLESMKNLSTGSGNDSYHEYYLHSVVCQIDDGHQKNLVSLINVDQRYFRIKMANNNKCQKEDDLLKNQWYIFNDFW